MANLEQHLNSLPDKQKTFLTGTLQHYPNIVIPVLGIVCGKEVFDYFINIYKQSFANKQPGQQSPQQGQLPQNAPHPATGQAAPQQNSAPAPQGAMPNAGPPQQAPAPQQ